MDNTVKGIDAEAVRKALPIYRALAWIVGIALVVLMCVGMPLKYLASDPNLNALGAKINMSLGIAHGWLYMALLASAINLGMKAKWDVGRLIGIALAGTIPFLSFVAEHFATKDVRRKLARLDDAAVSRETSVR
ncbi:DUF3817 domain-containing protein [Mariniluteicoccus endophyticus]